MFPENNLKKQRTGLTCCPLTSLAETAFLLHFSPRINSVIAQNMQSAKDRRKRYIERHRNKEMIINCCHSLPTITAERCCVLGRHDVILCCDKDCMARLCVHLYLVRCVFACVGFRVCGLGGPSDVKHGDRMASESHEMQKECRS